MKMTFKYKQKHGIEAFGAFAWLVCGLAWAADEAKELAYPPAPEEPRYFLERSIYSNLDVEPPRKQKSMLERLVAGADRVDAQGFSKPYAVAARKGVVYVSDSAAGVVHRFDIPNQKYSKIGEDEAGGDINKVLGIDVDDAGNLYVADVSAKKVKVYDPEGRFLRDMGDPKLFGSRMASVSVNPEGTRIYVTEIGGIQSKDHRVVVLDAQSGKLLFTIGKRGEGQGEFNLPRDVAIGKEGRIYVVDGGNFRIQVFDKDGKFLKTFGEVGKYPGTFSRPKEIAADKQGNIYVVDAAFGNFQIFDPDGQLLLFIGDRSEKDAQGKYMLPSGIAVDEDGRIYFVDQWFRKLEVFRPASLKRGEGALSLKPAVPKAEGKVQGGEPAPKK